ncbi:hypothetical protein ABBQ38_012690 [Trebouxia sp. C0009 RCD-2024]
MHTQLVMDADLRSVPAFLLGSVRQTYILIVILTGSTLLAALCVLALKSLPPTAVQRPVTSPSARLKLKVKAILSTDLPPHGLWQWLCGGLNVLDALLVVCWLGLTLTWTYAKSAGRIPRIRASVAAGTSKRSYSLQMLDGVAQSFGWAATPNILLLFYPVPRNCFLHWLFGTDFSGLIKYHRWLGTGTIWTVTMHLLLYFCLWWHTSTWVEEVFHWPARGVSNLAGVIAWVCGMIMLMSSTSYIRRRWYSVFYTCHILGFIGFMAFAFMHYQGMWYYTFPGFALYLLDATFRIAQRMHTTPAHPSSQASDDGTLATLTFRWSHVAEVLPSQIMWVNVPSVSVLHWHPVSVAHVQLDDTTEPNSAGTVTVHFKAYGAWTKALVKELQTGQLPLVRATGPFGCSRGHKWGGHQVMVIFAGGIGITPMLGMLRHMAAHARARKTDPSHDMELPSKVYLVWAARSRAELALLDQELIDIAREDEAWLDIKLHCTSKDQVMPSRTDTAKALASATHLPGAADSKPSDARAVASRPDAISLSDVTYDGSSSSSWASASAFFIQPGGLMSYHFGNLQWAAAHVASLFGAYFAGVLIYAYSAEKNNTGPSANRSWLIGLLLFGATCIMTMGMASAVILPMHFYRYLSDRRQARSKNGSAASSDMGGSASQGSLDKKMNQLEAQDNIEVAKTRPDLAAVLQQTMAAHSGSQEISVFVAGPEIMYIKAKQICAYINSQAAGKTAPFLSVHRQAYSL